VSLQYASPYLGNLVAARLPREEFERRLHEPLGDAEPDEIAALVRWFSHRYPTPKERLAYARRKLRQLQLASGVRPSERAEPTYLETARRLARAHRAADPATLHVLLDPDPAERVIRLVEVTASASTAVDPFPVGFAARPELGVPFASTVLLLSPEQWDSVRASQISLPAGCDADRLQPM
jgi:hypothetical protein